MDLWLFALIALLLIPVVRVFMAAGCRPAAPPPGDPRSVRKPYGYDSFRGTLERPR